MSRQERFDCSALIGGLIALLLIGWHQPQPVPESPAAAPVAAVQQAAVQLAEPTDEPSGIAGLTVAELTADAAASLALLPPKAPSGQWTMIPEYAASYEGGVPELPATYFTIESIQHPGVFHAFNMVATRRA